jgi:hypothetical protein
LRPRPHYWLVDAPFSARRAPSVDLPRCRIAGPEQTTGRSLSAHLRRPRPRSARRRLRSFLARIGIEEGCRPGPGNRGPPTHSCQNREVHHKGDACCHKHHSVDVKDRMERPGMNTEEARVKISGRQGWDHRDDKPGVEPALDRDLPRRSVEILRDLGLSKEKIVAYHRRFPTPPMNCGC